MARPKYIKTAASAPGGKSARRFSLQGRVVRANRAKKKPSKSVMHRYAALAFGGPQPTHKKRK